MRQSTDFARDIISSKELSDITPCDNFVPYLVQKYLSGASPQLCNLLNSVLNNRLLDWRDDQAIFDFLKCVLPKSKTDYFKYFGKPSDKKTTKVDVAAISDALEISKKELLEMIECFPELEETMVEQKEKILKAKK